MSSNYKIRIDEDETILLDEDDEEVDYPTAEVIIKKLTRSYFSERETIIYVIYSPRMDLHKIGITNNIAKRVNSLRQQYEDNEIDKIYMISCPARKEASIKERLLHQLFTHLNIALSPINDTKLGREWFQLTPYDIAFIKSRNLFLPFQDSFVFNPMTFMRYVLENDFCNQQIRQILVFTSELWVNYYTHQDNTKLDLDNLTYLR